MPESDSGAEHIAELEPDPTHAKGCVTKHDGGKPKKAGAQGRCCYRGQGYDETKNNGAKRALYEIDFTIAANKARLPMIFTELIIGGSPKKKSDFKKPTDPRKSKTAWWFKGNNFIFGYKPYNHNGHHILPFEAMAQLSYAELRLVQDSGYNLNDKPNMIILPCNEEYGYALRLPAHPYDHPSYTKAIKKMIAKLKQKLAKKKKNHKLTKKNANNFKSDLETWQQNQYWKIVDFGKTGNKGKKRAVMDACPLARQVSPRR
ncbi:MAG TPA: AHH domain-containing protein [Myxococcaceae bacterium]|jgi:hypothetical protein